jgi:hypothetical protein
LKRPIFILGGLLIVVAAWYLFAANAVIAESYRLSDAKEKRDAIAREVETLRAQTLAASAPEALEAKAKALGFVPIDRASYLAVPGTTVARR